MAPRLSGYLAPTPIRDSRLTRLLIQQPPSVDLVPWYRSVGGDQGNAFDSLENSLVVSGTGQLMTSSHDYTIANLFTLQPIHYLAPLLQAKPCFSRTSTSTTPPLVPTASCNSGSVARLYGSSSTDRGSGKEGATTSISS
jgi:hypothetical protein